MFHIMMMNLRNSERSEGMELLRLENQHLKERFKQLQGAQERAKATVAVSNFFLTE
jgi:hypothetical protein